MFVLENVGMPKRKRFSAFEKRVVAARQSWSCAGCKILLPATFEIDHVVPLHLGGDDCLASNAHALCPRCHSEKTLKENIERTNARQKKRRVAIEESRKSDPLSEEYEDPLCTENPFLRFAFVRL